MSYRFSDDGLAEFVSTSGWSLGFSFGFVSRELSQRSLLSSLVCDKTNTSSMSCFEPLYESEALCIVFIAKRTFHLYANKTNFHIKSFALSVTFIMRFKTTRKRPFSKTFITTRSGLCLSRYRTSKLLKLSCTSPKKVHNICNACILSVIADTRRMSSNIVIF